MKMNQKNKRRLLDGCTKHPNKMAYATKYDLRACLECDIWLEKVCTCSEACEFAAAFARDYYDHAFALPSNGKTTWEIFEYEE